VLVLGDVENPRPALGKQKLCLRPVFQPHDPELEQTVGFQAELLRVVDGFLEVGFLGVVSQTFVGVVS
jgi:hypothetical protein